MLAKIPATGGGQSYEKVLVGKIKLAKGELSLKIRPVVDKWKPINLRSITLKPVKNEASK